MTASRRCGDPLPSPASAGGPQGEKHGEQEPEARRADGCLASLQAQLSQGLNLHTLLNDPLLVVLLLSFLPSSADVRALLVAALPPPLSPGTLHDASSPASCLALTDRPPSPGLDSSLSFDCRLTDSQFSSGSITPAGGRVGYASLLEFESEAAECTDFLSASPLHSLASSSTRQFAGGAARREGRTFAYSRHLLRAEESCASAASAFPPPALPAPLRLPAAIVACFYHSLCFRRGDLLDAAAGRPLFSPQKAFLCQLEGSPAPRESGEAASSAQALLFETRGAAASAEYWRNIYFTLIHGSRCDDCGAELEPEEKTKASQGSGSSQPSEARSFDRAAAAEASALLPSSSVALPAGVVRSPAAPPTARASSSPAPPPPMASLLPRARTPFAPCSACVCLCRSCRGALRRRAEILCTLQRIVADVACVCQQTGGDGPRRRCDSENKRRRGETGVCAESAARPAADVGQHVSDARDPRQARAWPQPGVGGGEGEDRRALAACPQRSQPPADGLGGGGPGGGGTAAGLPPRSSVAATVDAAVEELFRHGGLFVAQAAFQKLLLHHRRMVQTVLRALGSQIRQELLRTTGVDFFRRVLSPLLEASKSHREGGLDEARHSRRAGAESGLAGLKRRRVGPTAFMAAAGAAEVGRRHAPERKGEQLHGLFRFSDGEKKDLGALLQRCFHGLAMPAVSTLLHSLGGVRGDGECSREGLEDDPGGEAEAETSERWEQSLNSLASMETLYATRTSFLLLVNRFHRLLEHPDLPLLHTLYVQRVQTARAMWPPATGPPSPHATDPAAEPACPSSPQPGDASPGPRALAPPSPAAPASASATNSLDAGISQEEARAPATWPAEGKNGSGARPCTQEERRRGGEGRPESEGGALGLGSARAVGAGAPAETGLWTETRKDDIELVCCWRILECLCTFLFDGRSRRPIRCYRKTLATRQFVDHLYRLAQDPTAETALCCHFSPLVACPRDALHAWPR
ncbi:hypothetical protein BESB_014710 [Besnoitia besnoiti]|uniref:Uncharacterized protein n=1 Tax=Besnoitia besnoiti TaxID=94643 RepID=A0A2A9M2Z4_BESBE|nr:hypothetical protein BESB_014710 [Besnoitia besnoiti]PFH32858.1 hypothetical protein BESB_014710 [Besnoitia besnoiti]